MKKSILVTGTLAGIIASGSLFAGPNELFQSKCGKCHFVMVGGAKVGKGSQGPELTGIIAKRSAAFVKAYSKNPEAARKEFADIYAKEIKPKRDNGTYKKDMKTPEGLSDADLESILTLLK